MYVAAPQKITPALALQHGQNVVMGPTLDVTKVLSPMAPCHTFHTTHTTPLTPPTPPTPMVASLGAVLASQAMGGTWGGGEGDALVMAQHSLCLRGVKGRRHTPLQPEPSHICMHAMARHHAPPHLASCQNSGGWGQASHAFMPPTHLHTRGGARGV
jgi:hypothetical protein